MKIRNGFVSNSSSSSFIVFGYNIDELGIDREDIIAKFAPKMLTEYKGYDQDDDIMCEMWMDFCNQENVFGHKDIGVVENDGNDYIGVVIMNSNEGDGCTEEHVFTKYLMKEIKESTKTYLKKIKPLCKELGITKEPKILKGVWNW